jgi:stearoyl-CoA desaturase (delta-9 desaturase)
MIFAAMRADPRAQSTAGAKTFSSPLFHRAQRIHFALFDVAPTLGTMAALALIPWLPPRPVDLALFAVFWLGTGLGLSVGFHRLFSHRAFTTSQPVAVALVVMGSMAARGPMISWVSMHRRHHECADREGDLHSPNAPHPGWRGLLHAHVGWLTRHDYPNVLHYAPDLVKQPVLQRCSRHYHHWVILGLALPAVVGGLWQTSLGGALTGLLWGGAVRMFVVAHTMSSINSICHRFGSQRYPGRDNSRNNPWLAALSWGEANHNNHHAAPAAAAFGRTWYEADPGYWLIWALQRTGLAWDVRRDSSRPAAI